MYHITTTFNNELDRLIDEALVKYSKGDYTAKQVIQLLADGQSYGDDGKPLYPDADMTKETSQDVVEAMSKISGFLEDEIYAVYDEVFDAL